SMSLVTSAMSGLAADAPEPPRVAAITMSRDEADMLPRWVNYYGDQLGRDNLLILDDNSVDGSTDGLPCAVYRLPPSPWKTSFLAARGKLFNGIASGLLACYDVVIATDVDEFLVPDPALHSGLVDYLSERSDRDAIAPLALNVLHNARLEPPLDLTRPVLSQRRFVKFAPNMCRPVIKRIPADWRRHGIKAPFEIDRDLWLMHLKYYDTAALTTVAERRHVLHQQDGRGSSGSGWALRPDELASRLLSWVVIPDGDDVPEFDPREPDITNIVQPGGGGLFRSEGQQLAAMEESPLRQLPERFRQAL
ncbi:MAG: glycosyltransferase family 2 protein, partial [Nocardioidaceae bacterium]